MMQHLFIPCRTRPIDFRWTHQQRPELVARARQLVEESGLGRVAIAKELGVGVATVTNWRRRFGWVWKPNRRGGRAPAVPGIPWRKLHRRQEGGPGREYAPAVVEAVRRLFEEGALTRAAISARTGVGVIAIRRWARREGWRRPARFEVQARFGHMPRASVGAKPASPGSRVSQAVGMGPRFRRAAGWRYTPDVVARVRPLVEETTLSLGEIAVRAGVCAQTIGRWAAREGWQRPPRRLNPRRKAGRSRHGEEAQPTKQPRGQRTGSGLLRSARNDEGKAPLASQAPRAYRGGPRFRRGRGRRYVPDVVERVRVLVEGTGRSGADIAAETGLAQATIWRWTQRYGWQRPAEAPRWTRLMATERSGLAPRIAAGLLRLAALAEGGGHGQPPASHPPHAEVLAGGEPRSTQDRAASFEAELRSAPQDEDGGGSPTDEHRRAAELARACRRLAAHLARAGERDAPRLLRPPPRRRDRPREDGLFERARDLVENTALRQSDIAWRLGISGATLIKWKQIGGWIRPLEAPSPYGGPARAPRGAVRRERRREGSGRLDEAERLLRALEGGEAVGPETLQAAFAALRGAVEILQRRLPPVRADGPPRRGRATPPGR